MAHSSIHSIRHDRSIPAPGRKIRHRVRSIWHEAPLWVHILVVAVAALLAAGVVFVSANWPYRHRKIQPMLEDVLASQVTFSKYHRIYFPNPGFVATGITIRSRSASKLAPLGHIETMTMEGRWSDLILLRRRVQLVDITGFHLIIPAIGSQENHESFPQGSAKNFSGPDTKIERFVVHNSILEVRREKDGPLVFRIKQLEIRNLHKGEAMTYAVDLQNAIPTGHVRARGSMGPMNAKNFGLTPLSGNFAFTEINLHEVGDIGGRLDTRGEFKGILRDLQVETNGVTNNFSVTDGKPSPIDGTMRCRLNGSNGDLDIQSIDLKTGRTDIHVTGNIKSGAGVTNLDISVDHGHAEDVMRPFIHNEVPIEGPVSIKAHAYLGPPGHGFMERLRLKGSLDVPSEKLTDKKTEKSLSAFSERALGKSKPNTGVEADNESAEKARDVLSLLKGPATIENGVASTPGLTFRVAGAEAILHGTFRFHDEAAHLTGTLKMKTDISHTTTGFKAFLLKPLAPFFKKKHVGAVIPIAVTGTPGHYRVTQDIGHKK
jgi:hypothetical protein